MDFKVYKDTVTAAQVICDTKAELPIETELLLPDYMPQVFKIVKCFVQLVVLQKQVSAARLTIEGYLRLAVWYQSEENATLCQTEQKLPFSKQIELQQGDFFCADVRVSGETEYINCRAVNQRRIDIRGAYALSVNVTAQTQRDVLTALADCGVEQKFCPVGGVRTLAVQDKIITVEEDIHFDAMPDMILDTECYGEIQEVKLLSGKAVLKGSLRAGVLYRAGEGHDVQRAEALLPFNEIVDVDGADEACKCIATAEPVGCSIAKSDDGTTSVSVTSILHIKVYRQYEAMAVCDAFSTQYETELTTQTIALEREKEQFSQDIEVNSTGAMPDGDVQIIAVKAYVTQPEVVLENENASIRGRVFLHLICLNALGEIDCYDKTAEYTVPNRFHIAPEDFVLNATAVVTSVSARKAGADASVSAILRIQGIALQREYYTVLQSAACLQPRMDEEEGIALRIYYTQEGDTLFDVAKRYAASPQTIAAANELDADMPLTQTQLLIPSAV